MDTKYLLFPNFLNKCLTFSYDDGVLTDPQLLKIFTENGLKGTFNINAGLMSDEHLYFRLSQKEVLDTFLNTEMEIAVHGYKHFDLPKFSDQEILEEIRQDRAELSKLFNTDVRGMAYSYGTYDDRVVGHVASCGIQYARTIESSLNFDFPTDWLRLKPTCHHDDEKMFDLADEFLIDNEKAKLFYVWGHSYEFKDNNNWDRIEEFAKKMGKRENIWYATNIEIYDYIKAFEQLQLNGDKIYNPTDIDLYLSYNGKNILVKSKQEENI